MKGETMITQNVQEPRPADPLATITGHVGAIASDDLASLTRWKKTKQQLLEPVAARLRPWFLEQEQTHGATLRRWRAALAAPELARVQGIAEHVRQAKTAVLEALTSLEGGPAALTAAAGFIERRDLQSFKCNYPPGGYAETYVERAEGHERAFVRQHEAARWHLGEIVKKLGARPEIGPVAALVEPQPTRSLPTKAKTGGAR
jgi:hypothetical protein